MITTVGSILLVKAIGRAEFNRRLSLHKNLEDLIGTEVQWFSYPTGNILSTVALRDKNRGWNYVILKRNRLGQFHIYDAMCDFCNHAAARVDSMFAMAGLGVYGQKPVEIVRR